MRHTGKVKFFRTKNGCGFIHSDKGDVFVHVSNILENSGVPSDLLVAGEVVRYDLTESRQGLAALRVERVDPPMLEERMGIVRRVFRHKGFGFIDSPHGDVFFHFGDVLFESDPAVGDRTLYLQASVEGKLRAIKVRRL